MVMFFQLDETLALDRPRIAPPGCHQYFTEMTGELISFNFNKNTRNNQDTTNLAQSRYQPNLKYAMCIDPATKCQVNGYFKAIMGNTIYVDCRLVFPLKIFLIFVLDHL